MKLLRNFVPVSLLLFIPAFVFSQEYMPINSEYLVRFSNNVYAHSENFHSSIKPYQKKDLKLLNETDSLLFLNSNNSIINYCLNHNLVQQKKGKLQLIINPIISEIQSYSINNNSFYNYLEFGLAVQLNLSAKHSLFYSYSLFNSHFLPEISGQIKTKKIIPHFGTYHLENNTYTYHNASFYWSYTPGKYFNFTGGIGKQFWGEGYRSLLLSDNSRNYPYFQASLNIWNIKYVVLYSFFRDINYPDLSYTLENKYSTSHILSWNATPWLNLAFFESVIWKSDASNNYRSYEINYLNPIIFLRPVEFSLDNPSEDNVLLGAMLNMKIKKNIVFYSQLLLDEFNLNELKKRDGYWANKYGLQTGIKFFDLLNIDGLFIQNELNFVRPFTYSHITSLENYGNYHQALAHPLGANFLEYVAQSQYVKGRWLYSIKLIISEYGTDKNGVNYGQNIYRSYLDKAGDYGHFLLQGEENHFTLIESKLGFLINPKTKLQFEVGYLYRKSESELEVFKNHLVFLGIKTLLFNNELDF